MLVYAKLLLPSQLFTANLLYWPGWDFFYRRSSAVCLCHSSFTLDHLSSPTASLEAAQIPCHTLPDPAGLGTVYPCLIHLIFGRPCSTPDYDTTFSAACVYLKTECLSVTNVLVLVFHFTSLGDFGANHFIPTAQGRECRNQSRMWGYRNWSQGKPPSPFPLPSALFSYLCCPRWPHNSTQVKGPVKPTLQWLLHPVLAQLPCLTEGWSWNQGLPRCQVLAAVCKP